METGPGTPPIDVLASGPEPGREEMELPVRATVTEYDRFDRVGVLTTDCGLEIRFGASACTDFEPAVGLGCWLVATEPDRFHGGVRAHVVNSTGQPEEDPATQAGKRFQAAEAQRARAERDRQRRLRAARADPAGALDDLERHFAFRVPPAYRQLVLEHATDPDSSAYLWLPEAEWIEPAEISTWEFLVEPALHGLVPFAFTGAGDPWCWWLGSPRVGAEPEIILCPHDESEAEIFAPTFAAWLFRICLEYGTALEAASDGKEERRRLESWAEILETAGAGEMAGRLRQISAAPGTEIVTPIGREPALASAELIETSLRELLGPAYLETRVEWTVDA